MSSHATEVSAPSAIPKIEASHRLQCLDRTKDDVARVTCTPRSTRLPGLHGMRQPSPPGCLGLHGGQGVRTVGRLHLGQAGERLLKQRPKAWSLLNNFVTSVIRILAQELLVLKRVFERPVGTSVYGAGFSKLHVHVSASMCDGVTCPNVPATARGIPALAYWRKSTKACSERSVANRQKNVICTVTSQSVCDQASAPLCWLCRHSVFVRFARSTDVLNARSWLNTALSQTTLCTLF